MRHLARSYFYWRVGSIRFIIVALDAISVTAAPAMHFGSAAVAAIK